MTNGNLTIDSVRFLLSGGQLEDVAIGGRTDIFEHPEVRRWRSQGGKIVSISGEFRHDNRRFNFQVSYAPSSGIGRVNVEKKGRRTGDLDIREEGFQLIYEEFENFFVDV